MDRLKPQYTINITSDILYRLDSSDKTNEEKLVIIDKVRKIISNRIEDKNISKNFLH